MKLRKVIILSILIPLALILGVLIYGYSLLGKINFKELPASDEELGIMPISEHDNSVKDAADSNTAPMTNSYDEPAINDSDENPLNANITSITNILLFGLDRRNPDEATRSDTIIVVSLDKKNEKIKVTSLMRDMYVNIPGKQDNRINAAYAFGGAELAIKTVNSNFGLDVRNYIAVDFEGFKKLIGKVGGIDIEVKNYEVSQIEGVSNHGLQTLNGSQTLDYVRIRHTGNADYERTERQRKVLELLFMKIKAQGIAKIHENVSALLPYVETSLTRAEIIRLVLEIADYNAESIEKFRLPVDGYFSDETIRGMYVLVPDMEENKKLLHNFINGIDN